MKRLQLILLLLSLLVGPASYAQTVVPLPQTFTMSPGGVELRSGSFYNQNNDLTSGDLALVRTHYAAISDMGDEWPLVENGIDHSFRIGIKSQRVPRPEGGGLAYDDWLVTVHIGATTYAFKRPYQAAQPFVQTGGIKGRSLTWTGGEGMGQLKTYTFTDRDDTKYTFRPTSFVSTPDCGTSTPCAYVSYITKPDGGRTDFSYDTSSSKARLRMVQNNRGYGIAFDYNGLIVTKACAINHAALVFTSGTACPAGVPQSGYAYSGGITFTDPTGGVYTYTANSITKPGYATPWVTWTMACCNEDGRSYVNRQDFADGTWWTYNIFDGNLRSSFTGPNGTTTLQFDRVQKYTTEFLGIEYVVSSGPSSVTDPLMRTTLSQYCGSGSGPTCSSPISPVPRSQTMPEGNYTTYTNDNYDTPYQAVMHAKPGSGLADITVSATYAYSIPGGKTKPLTSTDANGNVTTHTYDATHGGVLTETMPAVGGIAPVKRFSYTQRYAWIKNAAGTAYVQAATPVWLLSDEKICKTSATVSGACAGGASDEVITTYDYGPNSGPNNLLLRGVAVTADGQTLRTCYGYDTNGRKISETQPQANLASCP